MNNRELASILILSALALFVVVHGRTRQSLREVVKALFKVKLLVPILAYTGALAATVWVASRLGLWSLNLLTATIFWFVLTGLAWYGSFPDATRDPRFLRRRLLESVGLAACFEFFLNLSVLPLLLEVLLQLVLIFLMALRAIALTDVKSRPARLLVDVLLVSIVAGMTAWTLTRLIGDWDPAAMPRLWREFVLPIWLAAASAPLIYLVALFAAYESLLLHLSFLNGRRRPPLRMLVGVAAGLRGNLVDVGSFRGLRAKGAIEGRSLANAYRQTVKSKEDCATESRQRDRARARLQGNAGRVGVDARGRVLDRREFAETKAALRWLATCHMGWHRRLGRYHSDLVALIGDFTRHGLPEQHGIVSRVRGAGNAWYAYRRTAGGHYFGMGGRGGPPSQWVYDGTVPPTGNPSGKSKGWTDDTIGQRQEWLDEMPM